MATEQPKASPFARSEDVSLRRCPYEAPPLVVRQIKAAPAKVPVAPLSAKDPMTNKSPWIARAFPKLFQLVWPSAPVGFKYD